MSRRMIILSAAMLLSFGLICAANVPATRGLDPRAAHSPIMAETRSQAPNCEDGKAVAKAIYAHLKKNHFNKKQLERINVFFNTKDKVVTLSGFISPPPRSNDSQPLINRAADLTREATTCETRVDNRLTPFRGQECTFPQVACGKTGVCLPADECNAR